MNFISSIFGYGGGEPKKENPYTIPLDIHEFKIFGSFSRVSAGKQTPVYAIPTPHLPASRNARSGSSKKRTQ